MKKKGCIATVIIFCSLLLMYGCETTSPNKVMGDKMTNGLNSCLGKLTKEGLLMHASSPTEKVAVDDGEIWLYKYQKTETKTTAEGVGSVLFPVQAETKSNDYTMDVMLRFNKQGVLTNWNYRGYITVFYHPFSDLQCK